MCTLTKAPPSQSDHIINTHMKQVKTLDTDLSWDHLNTVYSLENSNLVGILAFKKRIDTPPPPFPTEINQHRRRSVRLVWFWPDHFFGDVMKFIIDICACAVTDRMPYMRAYYSRTTSKVLPTPLINEPNFRKLNSLPTKQDMLFPTHL